MGEPTFGLCIRNEVLEHVNTAQKEQERAGNALSETVKMIPGACLMFEETVKTLPTRETFTVKKAIINYHD